MGASQRDAALAYAARGWSVMPLRFTGGIEERKRPLLDTWEPLKHQAAPVAQVTEWWQRWPEANIGLVMGAVSNLVALDLDGPAAVALLRQREIFLPRTAAVQTARGYHALYRHPGGTIANRAKLLTDGQGSAVDVRGDGGYVVAPPSVHGSGWVYAWVVPPEDLADCPPALTAFLLRHEAPDRATDDGPWAATAMEGVSEGARNDTAARLAGYWLRVTDGDTTAAWLALRMWAAQCRPPMPEDEARTVLRSIARRDAAQRQATVTKDLPRQGVVEGPEWADELLAARPREGREVAVPGLACFGGLVPGDLLVVAGRPGMGKSTWACQLTAEAAVLHGVSTFVVSTEMTRHQWGIWMVAYLAHLPTNALPVPLTLPTVAPLRCRHLAVTDAGTITLRQIRQLAEGRLGLKLLIVDHLGRVAGGRKDSRVLEVGDVARGLKGLAKDLGCTVVALCQLNRRVEGADDKRPRLDDLRESGEIEQEADGVAFLYPLEKRTAAPIVPVGWAVEKNRHGPLATQAFLFNKPGRCFRLKDDREE